MNKVLSLIIGFSLLLQACSAQSAESMQADAFEQGIKNKTQVQLLDVRTPGEYEAGHIEDALLANWNDKKEFTRRVSYLDKKKPLYVYCLSGGRSRSAASALRADGFEQVYELSGGINAWKNAQKPLVGITKTEGMSLEMFQGAVQSSQVVLVDVGAPWCPPCKVMEPVLASLEKKYKDKFLLVRVESGRDDAVTGHLQVTELPVFLIYRDGKPVWRHQGTLSEDELARQLFP